MTARPELLALRPPNAAARFGRERAVAVLSGRDLSRALASRPVTLAGCPLVWRLLAPAWLRAAKLVGAPVWLEAHAGEGPAAMAAAGAALEAAIEAAETIGYAGPVVAECLLDLPSASGLWAAVDAGFTALGVPVAAPEALKKLSAPLVERALWWELRSSTLDAARGALAGARIVGAVPDAVAVEDDFPDAAALVEALDPVPVAVRPPSARAIDPAWAAASIRRASLWHAILREAAAGLPKDLARRAQEQAEGAGWPEAAAQLAREVDALDEEEAERAEARVFSLALMLFQQGGAEKQAGAIPRALGVAEE